MLYDYKRTPVPDGSGAQVYAFLMRLSLPLFGLPGPGTPVPQFWGPMQPPQLYYNLAQRMDGKIGIVAGQMALQRLVDDRGITG